jgi:sec-independent protein translocase protein TatB
MLPELGGIELLAIAAFALVVVGPKDLPVLLRKVGKFVGKMRGMAQEFRASFDELARQSELNELRKEVEAMRLAQSYDPTGLVPGAYGPQSSYDAVGAEEPALPESYVAEPSKPAARARTPRAAKPAAAKTKPKPKTAIKAKTTATPAPARTKTATKARKPAGTVQ